LAYNQLQSVFEIAERHHHLQAFKVSKCNLNSVKIFYIRILSVPPSTTDRWQNGGVSRVPE